MGRVARLRALSWQQRGLLAEALVGLALSRIVVALVPFRTIDRVASRPLASSSRGDRRAAIARIAWAVRASARRVPFRAKCFEQGLAAVWMLRRRGMIATMHYGAALEDDSLVAHVWVTVGGDDVIGCENKDRFTELVRLGTRKRFADPHLSED